MNEINGPMNTNSNTSANTGINTKTSVNTNTNIGMNPTTNLNTNPEVKKPENEVKKQVVVNVNTNNKENTKAIEKSKISAVLVLVVLLILVVGGVYLKKSRNNRIPVEQPASAAAGLTMLGPGFTTDAATDITATSANLHGTIIGLMDIKNFNGQSTYFKYGTSATNPSTISSFSGAVEGELVTTIRGLQPDTTYYYRVVLNHGSTSKSSQREYGDIMSFKTLAK